MSVDELINLAKALSPDEQIQLVRAVEEDRYAKLERHYATTSPGLVAEFWHFETTPEGMELMQRELEKFREQMS